jgi:hypothetical protein
VKFFIPAVLKSRIAIAENHQSAFFQEIHRVFVLEAGWKSDSPDFPPSLAAVIAQSFSGRRTS